MKKKILIASILLAVTVIVLVSYFGCSQFGGDAVSSRTAEQLSEEGDVTFAEVTDKSDSEPQAVTEPQDMLSQLQTVTAKDDVRVQNQLDSIKEAEEAAPTATKPDKYGMLRHEDGIDYRYQPEMLGDLKSKSEESKLAKFVGTPRAIPGDKPESRSTLRYNGVNNYRVGRSSSGRRAAESRSSRGYGGIMGGGYGGNGVAPSTGQPLRGVRGRAYLSESLLSVDAQRSEGERIYAGLLSVTEDEIWVIARAETQAVPTDEDTPGCGAMLAKLPKKDKKIPLPLKHTDVKGQISGYIATVDVTQQFHNPYEEKIEAVYVFPLPQNAAINEFIMTIGERKIRGIIRERKEAEEIYREARRQGYVASLLTQERPNIFTQKVANIEPGKNIDVNIKYFNTLAYVDGWYEFVFPMVVGPRFNPPGYTDGVGAVARGKAGISGQKTEVQYLKPGERSGHDIAVTVEVDAGVVIEEVVCTSHVITKTSTGPEKLTVKLSSLDSIPNKDFVLRYKVAGKTVKSALVTHHDKRGGFFTLMLYPPENLSYLKRAPMEMIFVLDCSGSMRGKPIAKAKDAIKRGLRKLGKDDTFQVIRFSNNTSQFGPDPVPATPANIRKAIRYVDNLHGSGGTMMIEGIKAALDFKHDPHRFRLVSFMTDGYIGNEVEILAAIHQRLGASRIFSFGVGSSVNRYLLDRMAKLGKGAVAYIGLDDSAGGVVDLFYERISHPALTDVTIDWGDMQVTDMYPNHIRDLIVGRPVILTGRFKGRHSTTIRVTGKVGDLRQEIAIGVNLDESAVTHPGIACVWARKKIETLANQATSDNNLDLPQEIMQVALEYGLMSAYTAFIAVDSSRQTIGDHGITVAVPVPVPDGVRYETTVQN